MPRLLMSAHYPPQNIGEQQSLHSSRAEGGAEERADSLPSPQQHQHEQQRTPHAANANVDDARSRTSSQQNDQTQTFTRDLSLSDSLFTEDATVPHHGTQAVTARRTRTVRPGPAVIGRRVTENCANVGRAEEIDEEEEEELLQFVPSSRTVPQQQTQTQTQGSILSVMSPPPPLSLSLPGSSHVRSKSEDTRQLQQQQQQQTRVEVWVPRRVEHVCADGVSDVSQHRPQPVLWRSGAAAAPAMLPPRVPEKDSTRSSSLLGASLLCGAATAPSPLSSSSSEWCVTAYECVDVALPSATAAPTPPRGVHVSASAAVDANNSSSGESGRDDDDHDDESAASRGREHGTDVYDTEVEAEEEAAGAAGTRSACRRRRRPREDEDVGAGDERRHRYHRRPVAGVRRCESSCAPPLSLQHCHCVPQSHPPAVSRVSELRLTLPWLLQTSVLPSTAAAVLRCYLEEHVAAVVQQWGDGQGKARSSSRTCKVNAATTAAALPTPPPFWVSIFVYTHAIQTRVTTFASGLVHEAEMVSHHQQQQQQTACRCIAWPAWVPDAQWSLQVLTTITSAAVVLIGDIAAALRKAEVATTYTTPMPDSCHSAVRRLLSESHAFYDAVFGDAENKRLCQHVRDRLPLRVTDLSTFLSRPWCSAPTRHPHDPQHDKDACHRAADAAASFHATRWPSLLDVVHALALTWMQQCLPAVANRLHQFLTTHNPGVVLDAVRACTQMPGTKGRDDMVMADVHEEVYTCVRDFVHGVLHRWQRWCITTAAPTPGGVRATVAEAPRLSSSALQWSAHVNYATVQLLQWVLRYDPPRVSRNGGGVLLSGVRTSARAPVPQTCAAAIDMRSVLELLSLLPSVLETSVLPHEVDSCLRRACADVPRVTSGGNAPFHACFRAVFAACCYGATMLTDAAAAAVLRVHPGGSDEGGDSFVHSVTASPLRGDAAAAVAGGEDAVLLTSSRASARGVWQAWVLPLLVAYRDCRPNGQQESAGQAAAQPTVTDQPHLRPLRIAERVVDYALALLQLLRVEQRFQCAPLSRKRHRHASSDSTGHRARLPSRRTGDTEVMGQQRQQRSVAMGEDEEDGDGSSMCSPWSASSYATASSATTVTAAAATAAVVAHVEQRARTGGEVSGSGVVQADVLLRREAVSSATTATHVSPTHRPSSSPSADDVVATFPFLPRDGFLAGVHDWRADCRGVVQQWLAGSTSTTSGSATFTAPLPSLAQQRPPADGRVVHRRDIRRTRAFLLCLQDCIRHVRQRTEDEEHDEDAESRTETRSGCAERARRYDYLYGVLPPGLYDADGQLGVCELPAAPSAPGHHSSNRGRRAHNAFTSHGAVGEDSAIATATAAARGRRGLALRSGSRDSDGDRLRLTSTDSLSLGSSPCEMEEDGASLDPMPSSSTTLVSSMSASSSSLSQATPEC